MEWEFEIEFEHTELDIELVTDQVIVSTPSTVVNSDGTYTDQVLAGGSLELPDTTLKLDSHEIDVPSAVNTQLKIGDLIKGAPTPNMISATIAIGDIGDVPVAVCETSDYIFWISYNWNVGHRFNKNTRQEDLTFSVLNSGSAHRGCLVYNDKLYVVSLGNTRIGRYDLDGNFEKFVTVPTGGIWGGIALTDNNTLVVVNETNDVLKVHEFNTDEDMTFIRSTTLTGHSTPINTFGESVYGNKLICTSPSYKSYGLMIFDLTTGVLIEEVNLNGFVGGAMYLDDDHLLWWPYGGNSGMGGPKIVETTNWTEVAQFSAQNRGIYRLVKGYEANTFLTAGFNQFDHPNHRKNVVKHYLER